MNMWMKIAFLLLVFDPYLLVSSTSSSSSSSSTGSTSTSAITSLPPIQSTLTSPSSGVIHGTSESSSSLSEASSTTAAAVVSEEIDDGDDDDDEQENENKNDENNKLSTVSESSSMVSNVEQQNDVKEGAEEPPLFANTNGNQNVAMQQQQSPPPPQGFGKTEKLITNYRTPFLPNTPQPPPPHDNYQSYTHPQQNGSSSSNTRHILGRAVLTTPHRRIPAICISPKSIHIANHRNINNEDDDSFLLAPPQHQSSVVMTSEPIMVTKFSLAERLGCSLRDLRMVDPKYSNTPFSAFGIGGGSGGGGVGGGGDGARKQQRSSSAMMKHGFSSTTSFLPRKNGIIVSIGGHVRAIVMRREVLFFLPQQPATAAGPNGSSSSESKGSTTDALIHALVHHLNSVFGTHHHYNPEVGDVDDGHVITTANMGGGAGNTEDGSSNLDQNTESNRKQSTTSDGGGNTDAKPPFELVVIEALLGHVCSLEAAKAAEIIENAQEVLSGITIGENDQQSSSSDNDPTTTKSIKKSKKRKESFMSMQSKIGELLPLKNRVDQLEANCAEISNAILNILSSNEDMEQIILHNPLKIHNQVELLFEDFLLQIDEVLYSLRNVQSLVRNTEEVVEIELDLLRNRILRTELLLECSALAVGCGAAITGLFGMNLVSHVEDHQRMFYFVTGFIVVLMVGVGMGIQSQLALDNIW